MLELSAQLIVVVFFLIIAVLFSKDKIDATGWVLVFGFVAAAFNGLVFDELNFDIYIGFLPFKSLVYLIFMDIFIRLLIDEHVFEYMAVWIMKITKVKIRTFFYVICLTSALFSAIMEDVSVVLIINPIIFRATKILDIDPKPFVYGTGASIIIGNLLTPVASPVNIIFVSLFNNLSFELNFLWFMSHFVILFIVSMVVTLLFIDFKYIRKRVSPEPRKIRILLEIMDPNYLIEKKGKFFRYFLYLIIIISILVINYHPYLVVAVFVLIITLVEEHGFTNFLNKVNWSLPFLYIGLFLLIGSMQGNGSIDFIGSSLENLLQGSIVIAIILIFLLSSIISSYISKTLSLLIFASILDLFFFANVYTDPQKSILLMTLLVSLQLGGNLVPQSSSFILKTIEHAKERKLPNLYYKPTARALLVFTLIASSIAIIYVFGYLLLTG